MKPGNLESIFRPKAASGFGSYIGNFGKGAIMPPPAPPGPGEWTGSNWRCPGTKPADEADGYYVCCPSGWSKVSYGDTVACDDEQNIFKCGPLPEGADPGEVECVGGRWVPATTPIAPESMLAPDIEIPDRTSPISPNVAPILIGGVALLFVTTIAFKMLS